MSVRVLSDPALRLVFTFITGLLLVSAVQYDASDFQLRHNSTLGNKNLHMEVIKAVACNIRLERIVSYDATGRCRRGFVSGDLKLYQDRQFEKGRFSSWHPERKFCLRVHLFSYLVRWQWIVSLLSKPHGKFDARKMPHFHPAPFGIFPRSR